MALFERMKTARKRTSVRGASSKVVKPSKPFNWQPVRRGSMVLVVGLLASVIFHAVSLLLSQPVTRIAVNGEFNHVDKKAVIERVRPFLKDGFVMLDLQGIREQLIQQPWVFDVSLARHWPDEIEITVEEQTTIARWGNTGFLNHQGELFKPLSVGGVDEKLPLLFGPDEETARVMERFSELSALLAEHQLSLKKLQLNERNTWRASLESGVEIVIGSSAVIEKTRRFLLAYQQGLSVNFSQIESIDMRYDNGFSVAWLAPAKSVAALKPATARQG